MLLDHAQRASGSHSSLRAAVLLGDLVDRAAHVDVDDVRPAVLGPAGGFAEPVDVAAVELHRQRRVLLARRASSIERGSRGGRPRGRAGRCTPARRRRTSARRAGTPDRSSRRSARAAGSWRVGASRSSSSATKTRLGLQSGEGNAVTAKLQRAALALPPAQCAGLEKSLISIAFACAFAVDARGAHAARSGGARARCHVREDRLILNSGATRHDYLTRQARRESCKREEIDRTTHRHREASMQPERHSPRRVQPAARTAG